MGGRAPNPAAARISSPRKRSMNRTAPSTPKSDKPNKSIQNASEPWNLSAASDVMSVRPN